MVFTPRPGSPEFTDEDAAALVGRHMLVGLTYLDVSDNVIERRQLHGRVLRASKLEGIVIQLDSGEEFALPADLDAIRPADPGQYRLRGTGEVVTDPDFLATFTVTEPARH
jgi:hypothetical protein